MCNALLESKFGRQQTSYGLENQVKELEGFSLANYFPTNWRSYRAELGNAGYQPVTMFVGNVPEYYQKGYIGSLPLSEQPRIEKPKPFSENRLV